MQEIDSDQVFSVKWNCEFLYLIIIWLPNALLLWR